MNELTHVDLCTGIGGFALAATWAGFTTIATCDIDQFSRRICSRYWPNADHLGDMRESDFSKYAGATLLTAGFPCQPFSTAGKRRGEEDDRYIWPSVLKVVQVVKPSWFIGENVAGIESMALSQIVSDLESIGYEVQPISVPACAIGTPQRRARVWFLSYAMRGDSEMARDIPRGWRELQHLDRDALRHRESEPELVGVAHGIPNRMDRLRGLGNSIVPQVAFEILSAIAAIERG